MLVFAPFLALALSLSLSIEQVKGQYSAYYTPSDVPAQTEQGQSGTNQCGTGSSQSAMCQNVYMNSLSDFCLWAPPTPDQTIGDSERIEVAWCTQPGYGTRLIPQGAITGAHWLVTPNYIQITGVGNLVGLNILAGDQGGELDPHGADGNGNPIGGLTFHNGVQVHEWDSFISSNQFCYRICLDNTPNAPAWCQHIYDIQGCAWNQPGDYSEGFSSCDGDSTVSPPGLYVDANGYTSTFYQGDGSNPAPTAHAVGASSNCQTFATLGGANFASTQATTTSSSTSATMTTTTTASASTPTSTTTDSSSTSTSTSSTPTSTSTSTTSTSSSSSSMITSSSIDGTIVGARTSSTSSTSAASASKTAGGNRAMGVRKVASALGAVGIAVVVFA